MYASANTRCRMTDAVDLGFAPADPCFTADPYPVLGSLREAGRAVRYADRDVWLLPHFADVHAALRSRALGRSFEHRYSATEFGRPGLADLAVDYPRFVESERWSLLNLEPPDHTRIRRLVTKVFTSKAVRAFEPRIAELAANAFAGAVGAGAARRHRRPDQHRGAADRTRSGTQLPPDLRDPRIRAGRRRLRPGARITDLSGAARGALSQWPA